MSDEMVLNVSALSKTGSVSRVGGKYRFHVRVDGGNSSSCPLGWSGVTINVPTINSREKYLATNIQVSAIGCDSPSQYAPGDEIWGFLDDGSFGKKAATCLLMEAVREQWPPHERIALEAVLLTKYSKLDLHVRVWSTRPDTRDGFGDPDWNATTQKDQQGIAAYPISLRFSLLDEAKDFWNKLFGAKESPKGGIPEKKSNQPFTTSIPTDAQRQSLFTAAMEGDLKKANAMLKNSPGLVFSRDSSYGSTALHWAAGKGRKEIVELLLANGADVNAKNDGGESSLEVAVRYSQKEVLELFRQRSEKQGSLVSKLSDKLIMEILQRLRTSHIKVQGLRKSGSISELIDNVIPKLAYVQPQDSVRIFAAYQKSISSSPLIILRACGNEKDLCYDLDALLQDYSVHVDDHYSVVTDTENSIASIAVHNKGSANGRVLNIFVWREAELYRFIGQRGAYTDSTGLTVGRRYS